MEVASEEEAAVVAVVATEAEMVPEIGETLTDLQNPEAMIEAEETLPGVAMTLHLVGVMPGVVTAGVRPTEGDHHPNEDGVIDHQVEEEIETRNETTFGRHHQTEMVVEPDQQGGSGRRVGSKSKHCKL